MKLVVFMLAFGLFACQQPSNSIDEFDAAFVEFGERIAEMHCAVCHSVGTSGSSPREDAPPLRTVFKVYNPESLSDDFREHIHVGHPDMPDFDFTVKETEGLLAYLDSIQKTPK